MTSNQQFRAVMLKQAGIAGAVLNVLNKNPRLEQSMRRALEYKLVDPANRLKNTLAMSGIGAVTGVLGDQNKGRGMLAGAVSGAGIGRFGPGVVQKGLGRVLTNVMRPVSYVTPGAHDYLRTQSVKDMIQAVVRNKPMHAEAVEGIPDLPGRHALFRDYFGLKRDPGSESFFKDVGVGTGGGKITELNFKDPRARKVLDDVAESHAKSLFSGSKEEARRMRSGQPTLVTAGPMANFHVQPDGNWRDVWDFALPPGQRINSAGNLLRALVSPFGQPTTVQGKTLSQTGVLNRAVDPRKFKNIHESFLSPVAQRISKSTGAGNEEVLGLLRRAGGRGRYSAQVMDAVREGASGKDYSTKSLVDVLSKVWQTA